MRRVLVWGLGISFAACAACSLLTDLSPLGGDASVSDAPIEAPNDGFVLTTVPGHVTLDPKDSFDVEIDIARGGAFAEIVDVTVNDVGGLSGVHTSPPTLTFTASSPVKLHIDVDPTATTPQDGKITVLGISRTTQKSFSASFGVRIGSVLADTQTNATVTVPAYADHLSIKAWGAGGGAGGSQMISSANNALAVGGYGGGGGMSGARFATPPGSSIVILVGAAGTTRGGGSGGGYTIVSLGTTPLIIAGGGGGGGQGHGDSTYCNTILTGDNGLSGGGANGQGNSGRSGSGTQGGAAGDTNATAGASLQGGDGAMTTTNCKFGCADGGAPGGGRGGTANQCGNAGGGGGGGGWFGGGGGGVTQGGGGGSGFVSDAGADVVQSVGSGPTPAATTDVDFLAGSATGGTASTSTQNNNAIPATPGRVIIRLPKP